MSYFASLPHHHEFTCPSVTTALLQLGALDGKPIVLNAKMKKAKPTSTLWEGSLMVRIWSDAKLRG
jgi:hypothetical protein